jgi:hypothetical protein
MNGGTWLEFEVENRETINEPNALKIARKGLSRPPYEVGKLIGVLRVGHRTLRKVDHGVYLVVSNVW